MGTNERAEARLYDMHCHLGFAEDAEAVARCLAECAPQALSCTVTPAAYEREAALFAQQPAARVALGMHPWHVAPDAATELALQRFEALAPGAPFIGEVGLDFSGPHGSDAARAMQINAFDRVLSACDAAACDGAPSAKLLSIHAVRAAEPALDMLEDHGTLQRHRVVFHWFADSPEQLKRAVAAGCLFSVGSRMMATRRGREYARIIPEERLLLETDSPAKPGDDFGCSSWIGQLRGALEQVAAIRGANALELGQRIAERSARLLQST